MATRTSTNGDDRLMQYFDEELSSEEMEVMRDELEGDADLAARLEGLAHMRGLMGEALGAEAHEVDGDAMFAAIEARLGEAAEDDDPMFPEPVLEDDDEAEEPESDEEAEDDRPPLRVVPGGKKDDVPAEVVHQEPPSRSGRWIVVAGGLAAAAAVLFFLLRPPGAQNGDTGGGDPAPLAAAGSDIEDVDFGYSTGSIFTVEDPEEDTHYAVVWISDEEVAVEDDTSPDDDAPEQTPEEPEELEDGAPDTQDEDGAQPAPEESEEP